MSSTTIEPISTSTHPLLDPSSGEPTSGPAFHGPTTSSAGGLPAPRDLPIAGDLAAQLAALFVKELREDRKRADKSSDLQELSRMREGEMRVADLHTKADAIRSEGLARGLAQLAGAACNVGGGVFALTTDSKSSAALAIGEGGAKGFDFAGTVSGNGFQARAVDRQAEADRHESVGEARKVARDKFSEQATDAKQLIERVIELTKELTESRNATLLAAASMKA